MNAKTSSRNTSAMTRELVRRQLHEKASGPPDGENACQSVPDWKRRQLIQPRPVRRLEPTVGQRLARLNPFERAAVQELMRSMLLRKTIKRILHEAFHSAPTTQSMQTDAGPAPLMTPASESMRSDVFTRAR